MVACASLFAIGDSPWSSFCFSPMHLESCETSFTRDWINRIVHIVVQVGHPNRVGLWNDASSACSLIPFASYPHAVCVVPLYRLRSEEHTSELQSRKYLVCRLLL